MGGELATIAGDVAQLRKTNHEIRNTLQALEIRLGEIQDMQVTKGEMIALGSLVRELVQQGNHMKRHILEDSSGLGDRLLRLERHTGLSAKR
jgi:hypothetical protein